MFSSRGNTPLHEAVLMGGSTAKELINVLLKYVLLATKCFNLFDMSVIATNKKVKCVSEI